MHRKEVIFCLLILLSFSFEKQGIGERDDFGLYRRKRLVTVDNRLAKLLDKWTNTVSSAEEANQSLFALKKQAALAPELESDIKDESERVIKLNQEVGNLESKINDRMKKANDKGYDEFWEIIRGFQKERGIELVRYWDAKEDESTKLGWEEIYENPHHFRNLYYFLNVAELPKGTKTIFVTKTPPQGVTWPIGYQIANCRGEIFQTKRCDPKEISEGLIILYVDPTETHDKLIGSFDKVLIDIAKDQTKVFIDESHKMAGSYCDETSLDYGFNAKNLEDLINHSEHIFGSNKPDPIWFKQLLLSKLYEERRKEELSDNDPDIKSYHMKNISRNAKEIERDKVPQYSRFSRDMDGTLTLVLGLSDITIPFPEIYMGPPPVEYEPSRIEREYHRYNDDDDEED